MKIIECTRCASKELQEEGGYFVCAYCMSRFTMGDDEQTSRPTTISISSDIEALLQKCRNEPSNSRRYAMRVLDLDPTNEEALAYLI